MANSVDDAIDLLPINGVGQRADCPGFAFDDLPRKECIGVAAPIRLLDGNELDQRLADG
jgi:hypothetical protein